MKESCTPVYGYDSAPAAIAKAKAQYGNAVWRENKEYRGPQTMLDSAGLNEVQGWVVVDVDVQRTAAAILASIEERIAAAQQSLGEAVHIAKELLMALSQTGGEK
jgi:hypothetical protein